MFNQHPDSQLLHVSGILNNNLILRCHMPETYLYLSVLHTITTQLKHTTLLYTNSIPSPHKQIPIKIFSKILAK